jgi:DNA-binding NtrC family response regulator
MAGPETTPAPVPHAKTDLAPLTVVLAEDDDDLRGLVATLLRKDGHKVIEARDGRDLMAYLAWAYLSAAEGADEPLVVTDLRLPVTDGLSVIQAIGAKGRRPPFILMTGFGDQGTHAEAVRVGALAVLNKPFDFDQLRNAVRQYARSRSTG